MAGEKTHNIQSYTLPDDTGKGMVGESAVAFQCKSIETLKLQCLELIMQLDNPSVLISLINEMNAELSTKETMPRPYTLEELRQRNDLAYTELEDGGGKDGCQFFAELKEKVMS